MAEGSNNSFTSVDISDPTNPVIRATIDRTLGGILRDVALSGGFAFGADVFFVNGVPIIDVSIPENPLPRAFLDFSGFRADNGTGIAVDDNFVYLTAALGINSRLYIGQFLALEDTAGIAPTVSIASPSPGDTVIEGSTLPITVEATDDIAVAGVDFLIDGEVVFTDTTVPYQFDFTVPAGVGAHTVGATAIDLGNNVGVAGDVVIDVLPVVTLTVPTEAGTVIEGSTITVSADAFSGLQGARVDFFVDGELVQTDTEAPFSVQIGIPLGVTTLTIGATVTDNLGVTGSDSLMVAVIPDPLTTVVGRVVDDTGVDLGGINVQAIGRLSVSQLDGSFSIPGVPTIFGDITAVARGTLNRSLLVGNSPGVAPVRGGTTDVGDITVRSQLQVFTGAAHTCAVLTNGRAQCWGSNGVGQLGDGTTTGSSSPVVVSGISTAVAMTLGGAHTCAVLLDGTARCWGRNDSGQLGDGTTLVSSTPVGVTGIFDAVAIGASVRHTCAVLLDGTARCWGRNNVGQLGDGSTTNASTPVAVSGISTAIDIAVGVNHTCALLEDGMVECWGENFLGQLGIGTTFGPETCTIFNIACSTLRWWSTGFPPQ